MNREQYLAKRMWLCGTASSHTGGALPAAIDIGRLADPAAAPSSPLADHYRRLHYLAERDRRDIRR